MVEKNMLGNRYELLEKIGEGGMAEVYKAKCHILNRYVAVKILKKEFVNNKEFVEKFQTEARAAGSLSDSRIVNIYDVGSEGDINYIVMEYIKGKTLKEYINERGKIEYTKTIEIAIGIAKALECAHKNNIIHRDIKPHNIMITEEGNVKVTDFGIARVSNFSTITNTAKIVGSAHYFSPEQARGTIVDCRSDLYSLGILMYEMVTGKVPYDADTPVSIALKHIQESVIPPVQFNPDIPESLNNLILKCIEKEPIKRYQNAGQLIEDLYSIKNNRDTQIKLNSNYDDFTRVMDPINIEDFSKNNIYNDENLEEKDDYEDDDYEDDEENQDENILARRKKRNSQKGKGKKIAIIASSMVVVLAIIGILANLFLGGKLGGNKIVVPNIVGMNKDEAKKMVEDKGLVFVIESSETSDKPEGEVLSCSPNEGTKVKPKTEIKAIVSAGNKTVKVPDLKNLNIEEAKRKIIESGLNVGNIKYETSSEVKKDIVMEQSPSSGSEANAGDKIDLIVSKGEEGMVLVPNLAGQDINEVEQILKSLKLKLGNKVEINTNDKNKDGKVFNQSISPNTKVEEDTEINISYFKYTGNELP
ncbi:Stk1 family PASTA domain-containing Ser/Thr kinase [Haloimpatiens lingqiaonensis]|uniref:Stk1 family PASTA domain-containing Ser/Thr kinase n=1 Tax=Haloimpatiens lingqiaonensis TaxID=1380675 RepID=UPI0010FF5C9E|nr:Stk1 family PASTA domain-containing Ser/Thr kinase [Haloimpatiens lingqiaonensis]